MTNITVMLDSLGFKKKPTDTHTSAIQRRIATTEIPFEDFCKKVGEEGHTFRPGIAVGGASSKDVVAQQVFALDFDTGNISSEEVLERSEALGVSPALIYETFSSIPDAPRFRSVFIAASLIEDAAITARLREYFLDIFPEADPSCKDAARLFYGGKGILYAADQPSAFDPYQIISGSTQYDLAPDDFEAMSKRRDPKMQNLLERFNLLEYLKDKYPDAEFQDFGTYIGVNPCPICGHADDFRLYPGKIETFYCFGAQGRVGGDAISFLMATESLDFADAVQRIQKSVAMQGIDIEELTREEFESGEIFEMISVIDEGKEKAVLKLQLKQRAKKLGISARDFDRTLAAYEQKGHSAEESTYIYRDGQLILLAPDRTRRIANFNPMPRELIISDDGQDVSSQLAIDIVLPESTATVSVPVESMGTPNSLMAKLPLMARINPAQGSAQYLVDCIRSRCAGIPERKVYSLTGFKQVDGKLVYLHGGGAIGGDSIEVNLPESLKGYRFSSTDPKTSEKEAVEAVLHLFDAVTPEVSYPLLAFTYLAPLSYFLKILGIGPSFIMFLRGSTGSFKTSLALLYLSHYREYLGPSTSPPENFHSTSSALEKKSYTLKDSLLLVDDYHPSSPREAQTMTALFQRLVRASGDGAARSRLKSNLEEATTYSPRSLIMVTGEDAPTGTEESGLARLMTVDFAPDCVDAARLSGCQGESELLNQAAAGFIRWLVEKYGSGETEELKSRFLEYRTRAAAQAAHKRSASNIGSCMLGLEAFVEYAVHVEAMSSGEARKFVEEGFGILAKISDQQTSENKTEKPAFRFIAALDDLISSKQKGLINLDEQGSDWYWSPATIGYEDVDFLYLLPGPSLTAVVEYLRKRGEHIPVGKNRLFKDLSSYGLIETEDGRSTVMKRLGSNHPQRYLIVRKKQMQEVLNV